MRPTSAAGPIADGIHVDPAALRIALALLPETTFPVSDAIAMATSIHARHLDGNRLGQDVAGRKRHAEHLDLEGRVARNLIRGGVEVPEA